MSFEVPGEGSTSTLETSTYLVEVLAVENGAVTKGRISYVEKASVDTTDGKRTAQVAPVEKRAYIVQLNGETVAVQRTTGDGSLDPEEEASAREDADFLGEDPIRDALPTTPVKVGQPVPALQKAIETLISDKESAGHDASIGDVTAKLVEDRGEVGVFEVSLTMTSLEDEMKTSTALKGTLEVRKHDSHVVLLSLSGPMTLASGGQAAAKGKLSIVLAEKPL